MFEIKVNNKIIDAVPEETILSALNRAGINIPTLCHIKDSYPTGACRICCVEVDGMANLVPSCSFPVQEGMSIITNSPRIIRARKTIVELLLANHPDDCLYCVRNGKCQLQDLAHQYGIRERRFVGKDKTKYNVDCTSPSIIRDQSKCILCGKCIRICEEVQNIAAIDYIGRGSDTVVGPAFNQGLNVSSCINCGQCIMVCPTGALRENSYTKRVMDALNDPKKLVVVQHAPAVSVSLAEEFNMKPGTDVNGIMVAALRQIGFDRVFDTSFSADLTIMEEASELIDRIQNGGKLPMITSCSPGWVKYAEQFYPDMLDNISTCKSPQQMLGAIIKSYYAEKEGIDPKNIFSVAVMPCTAKKFEVTRPEMSRNQIPDVDAAISTRELARMIKMYGIEFETLTPNIADLPFGTRSSAGKLFGSTGGVMEAAVRTAYHMITGDELKSLKVQAVRGLEGIKETTVDINGIKLGLAVVNGIGNAQKLLDQIKDGRDDIHFIEVMTCPGGCIAGGGQPLNADADKIKERISALYSIDRKDALRTSHSNKAVQELYKNFLGKPLGHKSHELLHTSYSKKEVLH
jgi:iron-only hydrogenase group A